MVKGCTIACISRFIRWKDINEIAPLECEIAQVFLVYCTVTTFHYFFLCKQHLTKTESSSGDLVVLLARAGVQKT